MSEIIPYIGDSGQAAGRKKGGEPQQQLDAADASAQADD
jgi:hypothetical protein